MSDGFDGRRQLGKANRGWKCWKLQRRWEQSLVLLLLILLIGTIIVFSTIAGVLATEFKEL
jgi:hypothetical protein